MDIIREMDDFGKKLPYYFQFTVFLMMHWYRMFLVWCHKQCIQPIENALKKYNKQEPTEPQWVQIYCIASAYCLNDIGIEDEYFVSYNQYFFPYTANFLDFIDNQYHFFIKSPIKVAYDANYYQEPQVTESLFIAKNDKQIIIRSFPIYKTIGSTSWADYPEMSNIEFAIVEYSHPQMVKTIELILPKDIYVVGNELLSNAFVLRLLELTNNYFIFDRDYIIQIMDHNLESLELRHNEYIEIGKNSYEIKKSYIEDSDEDSDDEKIVDEDKEVKEENEDAEIVETKDLDDSSTYSETNNWWTFLWGH